MTAQPAEAVGANFVSKDVLFEQSDLLTIHSRAQRSNQGPRRR
jgi:hypothetical protein